MGFELERFIDEQVPEDCICCICKQVLEDAVVCKLGNAFCLCCGKQHNNLCLCGKSDSTLAEEDKEFDVSHVIKSLEEKLPILRVACQFAKHGCKSKDPVYFVAKRHAQICPFRPDGTPEEQNPRQYEQLVRMELLLNGHSNKFDAHTKQLALCQKELKTAQAGPKAEEEDAICEAEDADGIMARRPSFQGRKIHVIVSPRFKALANKKAASKEAKELEETMKEKKA